MQELAPLHIAACHDNVIRLYEFQPLLPRRLRGYWEEVCGAYWRVDCSAFFFSAVGFAPQALAQQSEAVQQRAAEFARLYERWQETKDPEEVIALGEELLALEPTLGHWPLKLSRERLRGSLWFTIGDHYSQRTRGQVADNLGKAIAAYEAALTVNTREALPQGCACIEHILGIAYLHRFNGKRASNVKKAIGFLEAALAVRTRGSMPREHLHTANLLGEAHIVARDCHKAGLAYASAREAFLQLFWPGPQRC